MPKNYYFYKLLKKNTRFGSKAIAAKLLICFDTNVYFNDKVVFISRWLSSNSFFFFENSVMNYKN